MLMVEFSAQENSARFPGSRVLTYDAPGVGHASFLTRYTYLILSSSPACNACVPG